MSDDLPVTKIKQSLELTKEDFIEFNKNNAGFKKSKTKKHKYIDYFFTDKFIKEYSTV